MPVLFISSGISGCAAGDILAKLVCCALYVSLGTPQFVESRSNIHLTSVLILHHSELRFQLKCIGIDETRLCLTSWI